MTVKQNKNMRRVLLVMVILASMFVAVAVSLVAAGHICITSAKRPANQYEESLLRQGTDGQIAETVLNDADCDGIPDNKDILNAALAYVATRPHYKSAYYSSGYPNDEFGVCTDVVAFACHDAGYDLQVLMEQDIAVHPDRYAIEQPDSAIDFRRTTNLELFFDAHANCQTTDVSEIAEWQGGDIVLYNNHIGIVSDRRNAQGIPYLIHHSGPFQLHYEEDKLQSYGNIVGHYRLTPACLD